jgi:hypothetical protein
MKIFNLFHDVCSDGFRDRVFYSESDSIEEAARKFSFELFGKQVKMQRALIMTSESGVRYMCIEEISGDE